jgi:L-alanine-DL-glutamate epimerase-like enolase superfamily enzyme
MDRHNQDHRRQSGLGHSALSANASCKPMKIDRIEGIGVAVPLAGEFKDAYSNKSVQRSAIVRITASNGAVGLGNFDPAPGYSAESLEDSLRILNTVLAPPLLGLDPTNVHIVLARIGIAVAGFYDAKAAIEMACIDLAAKSANVPVHAYLGGAIKDQLLFNAWIGMLPPKEAATEALLVQSQGFKSAKIKVGHNVEADRDRIMAVREAVGPAFNIRIDANASYDLNSSIKLARLVAPFNLQLMEQPIAGSDLAGMAQVRSEANALGLSLMADESVLDHTSLIRIIQAGAADMVKLKVTKQGGFLSAQRMIATAEAAGMRCVIGHGFGLGTSTMAEIMLAATTDNVIDGLECVGPLKTADDVVTEKLDLSSGQIALPHGPGLGVTIDEDKLNRYRF